MEIPSDVPGNSQAFFHIAVGMQLSRHIVARIAELYSKLIRFIDIPVDVRISALNDAHIRQTEFPAQLDLAAETLGKFQINSTIQVDPSYGIICVDDLFRFTPPPDQQIQYVHTDIAQYTVVSEIGCGFDGPLEHLAFSESKGPDIPEDVSRD